MIMERLLTEDLESERRQRLEAERRATLASIRDSNGSRQFTQAGFFQPEGVQGVPIELDAIATAGHPESVRHSTESQTPAQPEPGEQYPSRPAVTPTAPRRSLARIQSGNQERRSST